MVEDPRMDFNQDQWVFTIIKKDGSEIELLKNGKNKRVTKRNVKEYVRLVSKYYLIKEVREELKSLLKGFFQVISKNIIKIFDDDELVFLMNGTP